MSIATLEAAMLSDDAMDRYLDTEADIRSDIKSLVQSHRCGIGLRDHYAGLALAGLMANSFRMENGVRSGLSHDAAVKGVAKNAFQLADAMLAESRKGERP